MDVEEEDGHVGDDLDALRLREGRRTPAGFFLGFSVLGEEKNNERKQRACGGGGRGKRETLERWIGGFIGGEARDRGCPRGHVCYCSSFTVRGKVCVRWKKRRETRE